MGYFPRADEPKLFTIADAGAAVELNRANGDVQDVTLSQACSITLAAVEPGVPVELLILLRGTYPVTWDGAIVWESGTPPSVDTLTAVSLVTVDGGASWIGFGPHSGHPTHVGASVTHSVGQNLTNGAYVYLAFDTERYDSGGHHFTSAANLTGTVAKTAASATLVGTGTSFTTELSVGQMISVPGTAAEVRVVTAIASNTSLTVAQAFTNSASGQTAARVNRGLVARQAGYYDLNAGVEIHANSLDSWMAFRKNGATLFRATQLDNNATVTLATMTAIGYYLDQWDYVELGIRVGTTGKQVTAAADYSPNFAIALRGT